MDYLSEVFALRRLVSGATHIRTLGSCTRVPGRRQAVGDCIDPLVPGTPTSPLASTPPAGSRSVGCAAAVIIAYTSPQKGSCFSSAETLKRHWYRRSQNCWT